MEAAAMDCGIKRFGAHDRAGVGRGEKGRPAAAAARGGKQGAGRRAGVNDWRERFEPGRAMPEEWAVTLQKL